MKKIDSSIFDQLYRQASDSHKGENGRLLVIGGSKLFHASIFWSADAASRIVDLVHFTSPANENNDLVRYKIKQGFWSGIVVDWGDVEAYIEEDDCVLIGPGMSRVEDPIIQNSKFKIQSLEELEDAGANDRTDLIVNSLIAKYPNKKWVVDGGALQEVDVSLLNENCIVTPHKGEWEILMSKSGDPSTVEKHAVSRSAQDDKDDLDRVSSLSNEVEKVGRFSKKYGNVTVLLKGEKDIVCQGDECVVVEGGNSGMTKGGTGDVLAGVVAGLYCKNDAFLAAQVGSLMTKNAGDRLHEKVGVSFNAGDLVEGI